MCVFPISDVPFHNLYALVRIKKLVDELQIQKMKNAKVCIYYLRFLFLCFANRSVHSLCECLDLEKLH